MKLMMKIGDKISRPSFAIKSNHRKAIEIRGKLIFFFSLGREGVKIFKFVSIVIFSYAAGKRI